MLSAPAIGGLPTLLEPSNPDLVPELWPFVVYLCAVIMLVATMLVLSALLGQRRTNRSTNDPFESGIVSVGDTRVPISVDFYLIAIFFVIFDLETVFIFAWAIAFFELGWQGYFSILIFVAVLVVALIYELKSGALEWGNNERTGWSDSRLSVSKAETNFTGENK